MLRRFFDKFRSYLFMGVDYLHRNLSNQEEIHRPIYKYYANSYTIKYGDNSQNIVITPAKNEKDLHNRVTLHDK